MTCVNHLNMNKIRSYWNNIINTYSDIIFNYAIKENQIEIEILQYDLIDQDLDYDETHYNRLVKSMIEVLSCQSRQLLREYVYSDITILISMLWKRNESSSPLRCLKFIKDNSSIMEESTKFSSSF